MPNDGYTLFAVKCELEGLLTGGKINKVLQPENDEIGLLIYNNSANYRLLLSCNPVSPRIHLTKYNKENPVSAPAFCMTLRKHLIGSTITAIHQDRMDRVLRIDCTGLNELYDSETKSLIIEIMGKHSNLILVNGENKILAAARSVSFDVSSVRQVLPGLTYRTAETQNKLFITDTDAIVAKLAEFPGGDAGKYLSSLVTGVSTQTAAEIVYRALGEISVSTLSPADALNIATLAEKFYREAEELRLSPCMTLDADGKPKDFLPFPFVTNAASTRPYDTLNEAIDACFYLKDKHQRFLDRSKHLSSALKTSLSRAEKKLAGLLQAIEDSRDYDQLRLSGELITSNLYRVKQGDATLTAENYEVYPPEEMTVALDTRLAPSANAQKYFKRYTKKKRTFLMNSEQAEPLKQHIDYLYSISESFENCTENAELADIARELTDCGVLKPAPGVKKKKQAESASKPIEVTREGYRIYVGKNNYQNDALTKGAAKNDLWLHASKIHGSHVIIANPVEREIPDEVIYDAACLAAYYSKARNAGKVPVDYTYRKFVKKPPKANAGMVIYTDQTTIIAEPKDYTQF